MPHGAPAAGGGAEIGGDECATHVHVLTAPPATRLCAALCARAGTECAPARGFSNAQRRACRGRAGCASTWRCAII